MKLITPFISLQEQLRIFHWQSKTYAQHKAFGKAYENLGDLIDQFVEVYSGKYGVPRAKIKYNVVLENFDGEYSEYLESIIEFLTNLNQEFDSVKDSELLNIRDEMLAEVNRLKYLLTLS